MNKLIIYFAAVKHILWGIIILFTPFQINTTTLTTINNLFPNYSYGGVLLILGGILAIISAELKNKPIIYNIALLAPLIFFVLIAGFNAVNAVLHGQYADGTIRPWQFILADQMHPIILMIFIFIAIFRPLKDIYYE